ncbi:MAG: glycosyltransferase [Pseudomonadota bacterium]|uniref:Glycosyltransferase n=1 Tax=Candidatus Desulfatibia profunda TaxID=2841695 RepID=A0A8J6NKI6_9BACT|nr:glycosyltransferase [Candidatus Desulfatibia profunda]MBL7179599.1 glycosyltransferase [Desulfobacterales bacterium]
MTVDYSVIIPAYNEEHWLPKTLIALHDAMDGQKLSGEVIVVDNNSTDHTAQVARANHSRVVFEPVNQISRARNAGAIVARGLYFIFIDADTIISPALLQSALDNLSSGRCCGGGSLVDFERPLRFFERKGLDLWNWASLKFHLAAGCFIYCLREGFEAVGGFSQKVYASEEIWFSQRLRSWGDRRNKAFKMLAAPRVITSSRKLEWFSPLQLGLTVLVATLFPFSLRFRMPCALWYYRPKR